MRRLLASDLDGTLLINHKIPEGNRIGIQKLKQQGQLFAISTGRPFNGISSIVRELDIDPDYFILNNGAVILDGEKNILFKKSIPFEIVRKLAETQRARNVVTAIETGFITYIYGEEDARNDSIFAKGVSHGFENLVFIDSMDEIEEKHKNEVSLVAFNFEGDMIEDVEAVRKYVNENFGNDVIAYRNTQYIDIVPVGCSKGQGVIEVGKIADISMEFIYTIGDSWNDDSMFEVTKNSFTFPYAEEALKAKTTHIVETVAECIEKHILK